MTQPNLPDPVDEPGVPPRTVAEPGTTARPTPAPTSAPASTTKPPRRVTPRDVVAIVFAVLIVIFIAENGRKTAIRFVGPEVTTYLWLALLIAAAFGFVLGFALAWERGRRVEKARRN